MSKAVFLDTSAWLALTNKSDTFHAKAKKARSKLLKAKSKCYVTDYVIVEVANSLSRNPWRAASIQLINSIHSSDNIEIIRIDQDIYDEAWNLYSSRKDKEWGLTDCTSFVVMKRYAIGDAFTNDHHFEQAGFNLLLK
jgi:hypothetical protein